MEGKNNQDLIFSSTAGEITNTADEERAESKLSACQKTHHSGSSLLKFFEQIGLILRRGKTEFQQNRALMGP